MNCKGFPLGVASDRLAERKYIFFYGCSCAAHIFSQKEQGKSLVQFLFCPWFGVCFMLVCTQCLSYLKNMFLVEATRE